MGKDQNRHFSGNKSPGKYTRYTVLKLLFQCFGQAFLYNALIVLAYTHILVQMGTPVVYRLIGDILNLKFNPYEVHGSREWVLYVSDGR